jgi:hypothetical protein
LVPVVLLEALRFLGTKAGSISTTFSSTSEYSAAIQKFGPSSSSGSSSI